MKITERQAHLIAKDIYDNLKIKDGIISPADQKVINKVIKDLKVKEKEIASANKAIQDLHKSISESAKDKTEIILALNREFSISMSAYSSSSKQVGDQITNLLKNKNKPTVYTIKDKVELGALKTEHKDIDKFIAEIAKQFANK